MNQRKAILVLLCVTILFTICVSQVIFITSTREKEGYIDSVGVIYDYYKEGEMSSDAFYVQFKDEDRVFFFPRDEISETLIRHSSGDLIRIIYSRSWIDPVLHLKEIRKIQEVTVL